MENKIIYDIAVVGAGPAGAVFAKEMAHSRPELNILLIDGQSPDSAKPCGGLLAPDAQKLLARFDLVLPKSVLEDPQIFAVETIDIDKGLVRYYQRHYLNMDRYAFDRWLLSLVSPSVDVVKGRCGEIKKDGELYSVRIERDGGAETVRARAIVGADGGGSVVGARFLRPCAFSTWLFSNGLKTRGKACRITPAYSTKRRAIAARGRYIRAATLFSAALSKSRAAVRRSTSKRQGLRDLLKIPLATPLRPRLALCQVRAR
jgi:hypothetical protein